MLVPAGTAPAGWYRDPADERSARFFDGRTWTDRSQPGAGRLLRGHDPSRPRALMTRQELMHRRRMASFGMLGLHVDIYL